MGFHFSFSEEKALSALSFVAHNHPSFTPLFAAKIFYFAEKWHINRYGRPIIADTYKAMVKGPVPSTIKNFIDENWDWVSRPVSFEKLVSIDKSGHYRRLMPGSVSDPVFASLSESDMQCLVEAIAFCKDKTAEELSKITHFDKAYQNANLNSIMQYEDFVDDDNPHRQDILNEMREVALYGVL